MSALPFRVVVDGGRARTEGLRARTGGELSLELGQMSAGDVADQLAMLGEVVFSQGRPLDSGGEWLAGGWSVRLRRAANGEFEPSELGADLATFAPGLAFASRTKATQDAVALLLDAVPAYPMPHQGLAITVAALTSPAVYGLRMPAPDHMSGWWLTEVPYGEHRETPSVMKVGELYRRRPDLISMLGLPFGFRFRAPFAQFDASLLE